MLLQLGQSANNRVHRWNIDRVCRCLHRVTSRSLQITVWVGQPLRRPLRPVLLALQHNLCPAENGIILLSAGMHLVPAAVFCCRSSQLPPLQPVGAAVAVCAAPTEQTPQGPQHHPVFGTPSSHSSHPSMPQAGESAVSRCSYCCSHAAARSPRAPSHNTPRRTSYLGQLAGCASSPHPPQHSSRSSAALHGMACMHLPSSTAGSSAAWLSRLRKGMVVVCSGPEAFCFGQPCANPHHVCWQQAVEGACCPMLQQAGHARGGRCCLSRHMLHRQPRQHSSETSSGGTLTHASPMLQQGCPQCAKCCTHDAARAHHHTVNPTLKPYIAWPPDSPPRQTLPSLLQASP